MLIKVVRIDRAGERPIAPLYLWGRSVDHLRQAQRSRVNSPSKEAEMRGQVTPRRGPVAAVILAGGGGSRFGARQNKVYLPLAGRSVISWSLSTFAAIPEVGPVVLVIRPQDRGLAEHVLDREVGHIGVELVSGGASRQESELAALRWLADRIRTGQVEIVLIHDGARPLVTRALAVAVIRAAREAGGAVPGLVRDDLAEVNAAGVLASAPHDGLVAVQTPQGFRAAPLLAAYEEAARHQFTGTDTASCVERFGEVRTRWVTGDPSNIKITYSHDLQLAEGVVARQRGDV